MSIGFQIFSFKFFNTFLQNFIPFFIQLIGMEVTTESSMRIYNSLVKNPPNAPLMPMKSHLADPYKDGRKNVLAIVKTNDRKQGIRAAVKALGGLDSLVNQVKGHILIKPNCNTDDPYPRDTHPETVRTIAEMLLESGVSSNQIIIGDMSGRARGLPTRATMENLGISNVADELGLQLAYFEEEEWVTVRPRKLTAWPDGLRIPRRVYDAERIIFTPILRSHSTAIFTVAMKLCVGLIDATEREWLHNGLDFYEKMMDINLAFHSDLIISDAIKINTGYKTDPEDEVSPGLIIASQNMVPADAFAVALMKHYNTVRVKEKPVKDHIQFQIAEKLGLGSIELKMTKIMTRNLTYDDTFDEIILKLLSEFT